MLKNIEAERARAGVSRLELSEKLGVSYSTIRNWLSGKTMIPSDKLTEMARMFGCSTDYLLGLCERER